MTPSALRDHIFQLLEFIVSDMESSQTPEEQKEKSLGDKNTDHLSASLHTHAALRFSDGFDIAQMVSEYRALRASVIKLWGNVSPAFDARDIDDMTRFNESIDEELADSVNFYTEKIAHSNDILSGILGHDLRGPLQSIMLSAELISHFGKLGERQSMLTKNIVESSNRMTALVNDLLDVTRARFGVQMPVVRSLMNMGFVAHQIIDELRIVHPNLKLVLNESGDLNGEWDKARIGQVFSNLLSNAIQYSIQSSPITVEIKGSTKTVILTVENNGTPIPPEKIKQIFDPLTRVSPSDDSSSVSGNLGLGLYIAETIVVAHGGTIEVTSSELGRTIFTARFPRSAPSTLSNDP
jgi:signal transduction histidine kinase